MIFAWLEQTAVSLWVREAPTLWAFPFVLFLHTLGLGVVAGLSVAANVWILTFAARYPLAPLKPFFPAIWYGFTLSLLSGILLLLAYPTKALTDPVFYLKLALIVAALVQLQWLRKAVLAPAAVEPAVPSSKLKAVAAVAIAFWIGAVVTGRLLAYTYTYLTADDMLAVQ